MKANAGGRSPWRPRQHRWLLACLLVRPGGGAAALRSRGAQPAAEETPTTVAEGARGVPLGVVVLRHAAEQLKVASRAETASEADSKELLVSQQGLVGEMAREAAEEALEKGRPAVPDVEAALDEVKRYASEAQRHEEHAREMAAAIRKVPFAAAEAAAGAIRDRVARDAYEAAEQAARTPPPRPEAELAREAAMRAAAASEPYHIALLRAQKYVAETYAKAKGAIGGAEKLAEKGQRLASDAQALQASGQVVHARAIMSRAHLAMQKAVEMKAWAEKLYGEASQINDSLGRYQRDMVLAAQAAQATAPIVVQTWSALPPLPPPPPLP